MSSGAFPKSTEPTSRKLNHSRLMMRLRKIPHRTRASFCSAIPNSTGCPSLLGLEDGNFEWIDPDQ